MARVLIFPSRRRFHRTWSAFRPTFEALRTSDSVAFPSQRPKLPVVGRVPIFRLAQVDQPVSMAQPQHPTGFPSGMLLDQTYWSLAGLPRADGRNAGGSLRDSVPVVKGGEKVGHHGGGIVYHQHDEKELNWEQGGIRSGAVVRSRGVSQESSGSSETWETTFCRLPLRR